MMPGEVELTRFIELPDEQIEHNPGLSEAEIARAIARLGLERIQLVCFDLPTEYYSGRTEIYKDHELKYFNPYAAELRALRMAFYDALRNVAYRTPIGWSLITNADLSKLNKLIDKLNQVASKLGVARSIQIYEVYVPRDTLRQWIHQNIQLIRMDTQKLQEKIASQQLKASYARKLKYELEHLRELLNSLQAELSRLEA